MFGLTHDNRRPPPPLVRSSDRVIAGRLRRPGRASGLAGADGPGRHGGGCARRRCRVAFYAWLWIMVPTADESAKRNARRPASPIAPAVSAPSGRRRAGARVGAPSAPPGPAPARRRCRDPRAGTPGRSSGGRLPRRGPRHRPAARAGRTAVVPLPEHAVRQGNPAWAPGLLLVAGILIARLLGVDVPLGTLIPGRGRSSAARPSPGCSWTKPAGPGSVDKTKADQAGGWARLAAGLALVVAGVLVMVSGSGSWEQTWLALLASVAVLGGVALVLLPWGLKFWRDLEAERAGRVRETERAEIAAHLHDSVLQTLALIQRRAGNEHDVVRLARAQERELRGWLYRDRGKEAGQLSDRIKAVAAEVEDSWATPWRWSAWGTPP